MMAIEDEAYDWTIERRMWWRRSTGSARAAKLHRALEMCGSDTRIIFSYDLVHPSLDNGRKGYLIAERDWVLILFDHVVENVRKYPTSRVVVVV